MTLDDYQYKATAFAQYSNDMYPVTSLIIEAAELADLFVKPKLRGDDVEIERKDIVSEAGDVLWNLVNLLEDNDISLAEVAQYNIEKLADRKLRGVIKGSGDYR